MSHTPPDVPVETSRKSLLQRFSIVWVIPFVALVIALGVAWQNYADRGPLVDISFDNAAGIVAGQTEVRFRDVTVGLVEDVTFSEGLDEVLVSVRFEKDVARYVDDDASFWVVRPEVSARGVTGLDTVLSGNFIEGVWDNQPEGVQYSFEGLPQAPLTRAGRNGLRIQLRAQSDAQLNEGASIFFKGIEVGRTGPAQITQDGSSAYAEAIIYEPHARLINSETRFWDASGFTFSLGTNGAVLDFNSIASLVSGGITFGTLVSGGRAVEDGAIFPVYADESTAQASVFETTSGPTVNLSVIFDENVSGLAAKASVELGGLKIGEVLNVSGVVDPELFGDNGVRLLATLSIRPNRLGLSQTAGRDAVEDYFAERVEEGLRARLATASILTGGLKVELVDAENPAPAELQRDADPYPRIPTVAGDIADVAATAEGVFQRINNLQIEELLASAIDFLDTSRALIANDDLQRAPEELRALLGEARGLISSDSVREIPVNLNQTLAELEALVAQINAGNGAERLLAAVDAAETAAGSVTTAVEGVPELVSQIEAVAAKAEQLPLDDLTTQLTQLLATADQLIGTEAARQLPERLGQALREVEQVLADLREGGTVDNVNETMQSAREAADAVADSAERLPELVNRADALLRQASATLSTYDNNSELNRDARAALREVQRAADAVASLARAIERRPNSILTGR